MSAHNTKDPQASERAQQPDRNVPSKDQNPDSPPKERERLRDILVVFVTYPLTPSKEADRLAEKKPWLEFLSLLLKVALALFALYKAAME